MACQRCNSLYKQKIVKVDKREIPYIITIKCTLCNHLYKVIQRVGY